MVDAAVAACRDPRFHHYSPTPGLPELREAIAFKTKRDSGVDCTAAQVVVTNGGKHAVYNTFQVLLRRGRRGARCPRRTGRRIPRSITLAGGVPVVLPTSEADGFRVTVEQLEAACTPRTKALLFVSPSNPTGAVYPPEAVEAIGRWALDRGIWVVTDEIYEHLTYDGHVFSSMPGLVPELMDQCVILNGVAKTYAMTGWRVGWMIGARRRDRGRDQPAVALHVERLERRAGGGARGGERRPRRRSSRCATRSRGGATMMYELLSKIDGVTVLAPQGAFYCFPSFEGVLGREIAGRTPHDDARAVRAAARRGQGRDRSRRGVRCARLRPAVVRARRRRPR